jgi:signal transduction histidine kinase
MQLQKGPSADTLRALETAPCMFLVLSPDLYIITASHLYLEAIEGTREAIVGKHIFDAFPDNPDYPAADGVMNINASLQEVLRTKTTHKMEVQRYDVPVMGQPAKFIVRYWNPTHTPILDDNGDISYIIQLADNVTEIMRTKLELQHTNEELQVTHQQLLELNTQLEEKVLGRTRQYQESEARFRGMSEQSELVNEQLRQSNALLRESEDNLQSAFDAADLGSCSLDLKTGKAEMCPRYRLLYGLPLQGEITWDMVLQAVNADYVAEVNKVLENAVKHGQPVDSTYPINHLSTGERRWMRVVGKVRADAEGSWASIYAIIMDVTQQKEDEQRKNDFIAMVSHELKTPLTSIRGYMQMLQIKARKTGDELTTSSLHKVERQIRKMTTLINGFLNISRLESGQIQIDKQQFNVNELVAEIREEYLDTISTHPVIYQQVDEITMYGDREKIGQVINNFISNAVKYSPAGSAIVLSCKIEEGSIVFSVQDNGIGISQQNLPKLFDRYYRVQGQQTITVAGFGIGLYLSAEIIYRHHGKIWAESEVGVASTFYFSLPLEPR